MSIRLTVKFIAFVSSDFDEKKLDGRITFLTLTAQTKSLFLSSVVNKVEQYDGDLKLMLAAYGAGSGAVAKYNGVPPYQETKQFVEDIMSVVDEKIMSQTEEPQEPVYQEYPSLWNEMRNFSAYTPTDYEIFLSCMLSMQSTDLLTPLDEQKERHQNFNPYLFYLG